MFLRLCIPILGRWVFLVDVTKRHNSVKKSTAFPTLLVNPLNPGHRRILVLCVCILYCCCKKNKIAMCPS